MARLVIGKWVARLEMDGSAAGRWVAMANLQEKWPGCRDRGG